jgi:hypothetical protein
MMGMRPVRSLTVAALIGQPVSAESRCPDRLQTGERIQEPIDLFGRVVMQ